MMVYATDIFGNLLTIGSKRRLNAVDELQSPVGWFSVLKLQLLTKSFSGMNRFWTAYDPIIRILKVQETWIGQCLFFHL